jgi:peroxiredoxin Q/BCP
VAPKSAKKRPASKKAKKAAKPKVKKAAPKKGSAGPAAASRKPGRAPKPAKAKPATAPSSKSAPSFKPAPSSKPAASSKSAAAKPASARERFGRSAARGPFARGKGKGAHRDERAASPDHEDGNHEPSETEEEAPARIVVAEPPIPPPSRRKPKPGSPDWPGESLTVGMEAPEFSLPSTTGERITLSDYRGKRVVLYFYPKDDTPGCTMEACAFRDNMARIESKGAVLFGISLDDELSHQRFAQKYNLTFPLLADVDAAVSRKYGTYKEKNLYGRTFWGIERTTFVVDRDGKVENVFRRVKVEGHADEVLATLSV